MIVNALSVDVEEYYHAVIFQEATRGLSRASLESRVARSIDEILELFARRGVRGTFFIVGEVGASHPEMVRRIASGGHEIACHSMRHELVSSQTPEVFREDVRRAKATLEDVSGAAVIGYRAPNYSIGREQAWAYDILLEEGFRYDSSLFPIHHDRYGDPNGQRFPYVVRSNGKGDLIEFPIATARLFGVNLPIGGGAYFRLFPWRLFRLGFKHVNAGEGRPLMFYFHPWEMDPGQPRPPMPLLHRIRHRTNLARFRDKLEAMVGSLPFAPAREVLGLA